MCGIAGFYSRREPVRLQTLRSMTDSIAHRGPNGEGHELIETGTGRHWSPQNDQGARPEHCDLALGHRRLAILDLSPRGHQPMWDSSGTLCVVYNGEIYNYLELRQELAALGHEFRTDTDTEVLLAAYREWGPDCLQRFNGMWAFALWDAGARRLFCARDRFGVKPFYYVHDGQQFVFGSEIKALLCHSSVRRRPNATALHDYLTMGMVDHTDETFFEGIRQLPGAHYLILTPDGDLAVQRWWDVCPTRDVKVAQAAQAGFIQQFAHLFEDAVRVRLRSDVPIGTCLSGGLDSSAIVTVANRLMFGNVSRDERLVGERQRTFSACFADPRFDERVYIDTVLKATGAANRQTFPSGDRLWEELPSMVWHMDEPFQSTSQYSQWNVMRCAAEGGVTVTLDGQGSDELMAGYPGYHSVLLATLIARGQWVRAAREARGMAALGGSGRNLPELLSRVGYRFTPRPLRHAARRLASGRARSPFPEGWALRALRPSFRQAFAERWDGWAQKQDDNRGNLAARLYDDVFRFSLPALLRFEDRSSMAFSLEARTPFLDYRLAELIFSMPAAMKIRGGWTKWVMREALAGVLPEEIQWRRDKKGFVTPEVVWLRQGAARIRELFSRRPLSSEFLDTEMITQAIDQCLNGKSDGLYYTEIWPWINVEAWMQRFWPC